MSQVSKSPRISINKGVRTEKLWTKDSQRIITQFILRMGRSKSNEAYEGRGRVTTMQARKACCEWTASYGRRGMCGKLGPIPCGVLPPILVEITTCEFTHMRIISMVEEVGKGPF